MSTGSPRRRRSRGSAIALLAGVAGLAAGCGSGYEGTVDTRAGGGAPPARGPEAARARSQAAPPNAPPSSRR